MSMASKQLKAVLLDLDGTLLDTKEDIADCLNQALVSHGLPARPLTDYGQIIGGGIKEAVRRAAPQGTPDEVLESINAQYQHEYPLNCTTKTKPFDGISEMLQGFQNENLLLAVITNKTESTSQKIVKHFFPETPFEFVWGNDGNRPLKPSADAGFLACSRLGFLPGQVGYLGDSGSDIEFAISVGMIPIGACWGYRGYQELRNTGADLLLDRPDELCDVI